jgi:dCTP deaminase
MSEGGILTGPEIRSAIFAGDITIDPLDGIEEGKMVNPASYDLTLGNKVKVYSPSVQIVYGGFIEKQGYEHTDTRTVHKPLTKVGHDMVVHSKGSYLYAHNEKWLDSKHEEPTWEFTIDPKLGWLLKPGIGYLMHTAERVTTKRYVPVLDGKSSIGRLFITAHVTAGYGDPGFDGQYTLEVVATHPVLVYPGMRFCQMRFHTPVGEILDYQHRGHYQGQASMGPVPSMAHRQFEEKFTDLPIVGFKGSGNGCHNG